MKRKVHVFVLVRSYFSRQQDSLDSLTNLNKLPTRVKVSKMVLAIRKIITIYEVLYSAKPRKISFNIILSKAESHHGQAHRTQSDYTKKKKKKKDLVSDDMCSSLYVSLTREGIFGGI